MSDESVKNGQEGACPSPVALLSCAINISQLQRFMQLDIPGRVCLAATCGNTICFYLIPLWGGRPRQAGRAGGLILNSRRPTALDFQDANRADGRCNCERYCDLIDGGAAPVCQHQGLKSMFKPVTFTCD